MVKFPILVVINHLLSSSTDVQIDINISTLNINYIDNYYTDGYILKNDNNN